MAQPQSPSADGGGSDGASGARAAMEASRLEVMECERQIAKVKSALKALPSSGGTADEPDKPNALRVSALKVTGLPPAAEPSFRLQLSSPIEELTLTKLHDPLNPNTAEDGSVATFEGVDLSVATLTVSAYDGGDVPLGSSVSYDVAPLCDDFDPVTYTEGKKVKKELEVAILAPGTDSGKKEGGGEAGTKEEGKGASGGDDDGAEEDKFEDAVTDDDEEEEGAGGEKEDTSGKTEGEKSGETSAESGAPASETKESKSDDAVLVTKAEDNDAAEKTTQSSSPSGGEGGSEGASDAETKEENEADKAAAPKTTETPPAEGETKEDDSAKKPSSSTAVEVPVCTVTLRVEYDPSLQDRREGLYDKLNALSKKKAAAIDRLRRSAAAVARSKPAEGGGGPESPSSASEGGRAVKSGFLNKKSKATSKEPGVLKRWYEKTIGPDSLFRKVAPVAKNYVLFFGSVALFHYQGHLLALPAPV